MQPPASSSRPALVGAFGKIPKVGDFVRVGLQNEATRAFEEWLHQGVQVAHDKRGSAWKTGFLAGAIYGFVHRGIGVDKKSTLIAGVLKPSHDSVGRAFPLAVFAPIDPEFASAQPHLVPLAVADYLDQCVTLVTGADAMASAADFEAQLRGVTPPTYDGNRLFADYDWWTQTTPVSRLWQAVFGGHDGLGDTATAFDAIQQSVLGVRGVEPATSPLSLRLPLGSGGVVVASFWLDLVRRAARWRHTMPSCFWFFDGASGDVLVQTGRTPPSSLVELWLPDPKNDNVYDLRMLKFKVALSQIAPRVADCLRRGGTVGELLNLALQP